jgi:hypothetical protein
MAQAARQARGSFMENGHSHDATFEAVAHGHTDETLKPFKG